MTPLYRGLRSLSEAGRAISRVLEVAMPLLPPIVSFVARSGTGKTTYLEGLLPALGALGVRVMAVKHDVHRFEIDKEGKDTWRLRRAGARQVLIANAEQMALVATVDGEQPLLTLVERYARNVDLVITEGYRRSGMPKVLVQRRGVREPMDLDTAGGAETRGGEVIAVVSDRPDHPTEGLPLFDLSQPADLAHWLVERMLGPDVTARSLTGVILAGGSRRVRGSEDLAPVDPANLPRLVGVLEPLCSGGVFVVRPPGATLPDLPPPCRVVDDLLPQQAALGGLFTGLALAPTPHILLAAADQPDLQPDLVTWLRDHPARAADVLLPECDGHVEPIPALYGVRCLGAIKRSILSGELRMASWRGAVRVERVPEPAWRPMDPEGLSFQER